MCTDTRSFMHCCHQHSPHSPLIAADPHISTSPLPVTCSCPPSHPALLAGKPLTPASLYAFFVEACRANLHMMLAMSPVGAAFRERLRKFPSLVNCCTIDWFSVWPADALKSVASK